MNATAQLHRADQLVDRAANGLRDVADRAAAKGGIAAKVADQLADDAAFLRRLKPSQIVARAKGEAPTNLPPASGTPTAPMQPLVNRPPKTSREGGGPNPLLIVGAAFVVGIAVAKLIDWRGHAHPRD